MHLHAHASRSPWRLDPTKTSGLRRRFIADMNRRFRELKKLIRQVVDLDDAFGLRKDTPLPRALIPMFQSNVLRLNAFEFASDSQKISAFMDWLRRMEATGQLVSSSPSPTSAIGQLGTQPPWWRTYIQTAYRQGLTQAGSTLQAQGVPVSAQWMDNAFLAPVHADRAGIIYTRTYAGLAGITAGMDAAISRSLAEGIASGQNPRDIARELARDVDKYAGDARRLAQTEVINAHAEATLNGYEEAGLHGVSLLAEFSYTDDNKVCPKCVALGQANGGIYTIAEARGLIPVHPNCRCAWAPVVEDVTRLRGLA